MKGSHPPKPRFETLQELLAAAARSQTGLSFTDAREIDAPLTFTELYARARRAASGLVSLGIRRGDRVALVLPTAPSFMDAFFGTLLAGATPVPLYPPLRLGRMEEYHRRTARMLEVTGARLVWTDARVRRLLGQPVVRARPELGCLISEEIAGDARTETAVAGSPEELALIQFSSGTTVDPKPVALSHRNVLANLAALDTFVPEGRSIPQAGVSWLPLYHDMGLIGCLLLALYHPGPLTLIPPELFLARPALWLRAISRRRATISVAPNFAYGLCVKRIRDEELAGVDLSRWRLALNGAEPVSPAVLRRFAERFAPWGFDARALTPVYGLSEAALAVAFAAPERPFVSQRIDPEVLARRGAIEAGGREVVSVGRPVPGAEVQIRDEEGGALPERRAGRIWVRSPSVMVSYFGSPEATARALQDGWLDTGDVGFVVGGELYLCGRAKELVILRGANHAPQEFEECLDGLEGVRAGCAAAFGYVPEGADGEELAMLVECDGLRESGLAERIRARVVERTGIRPFEVALLGPGTLPRTSSGKLRRAEAARAWLDGTLRPPARVTPLALARELLRSELSFARARLAKPRGG